MNNIELAKALEAHILTAISRRNSHLIEEYGHARFLGQIIKPPITCMVDTVALRSVTREFVGKLVDGLQNFADVYVLDLSSVMRTVDPQAQREAGVVHVEASDEESSRG